MSQDCSQIMTQRLTINCKCSANRSGFFQLTLSLKLAHISYLPCGLVPFSQYGISILPLCISEGFSQSTLLHPSKLSSIVLPNYILPCYRPINFFINQWEQYIIAVYKRIIPQYFPHFV